MPERFAVWEEREQEMREFLGKDVAILRDRSNKQSRPLTLRELRERHEANSSDIDPDDIGGCGCFVDEVAD
jgi:hypothetical protein